MQLKLMTFSLIFSLCYTSSCDDSRPASISDDPLKISKNNPPQEINKNPPKKDPEKKTQEENKIIRIFIAGDDANTLMLGGLANRMKVLHDKFKDAEKNHIIVSTANEPQLKVDAHDAIIHQAEEGEVANKILEITRKYSPERIVIFVIAHGALNGNICYADKNSCTLSGSKIASIIRELDKTNNKIANKPLKQLLIVPQSCFNNALAQTLFTELRTGPFMSFPVIMPHMSKLGKNLCGTADKSVNDALLWNKLLLWEYSNYQFKNWINAQNRINRIFDIKTLEQFVAIANEAIKNNFSAVKARGEISSFSADAKQAEINLQEFEMSLQELRIITLDDPPNQTIIAGHYDSTPQNVVHNLIDIPKIESAVLAIEANNVRYVQGTPAYNTVKKWPIGTDFTIYLSLP